MNAKTLLCLLAFFAAAALYAGDGHDHDHGHSHGEEETVEAEPEEVWETREAIAAPYELFAKFQHLHLGDTSVFRLFISDYASNAPLFLPYLRVTCPREPQLAIAISVIDSGIYELKTVFAELGSHSLDVHLGDTTLSLTYLEVETEHEHAEEAHEHEHPWYLSIWFVFPMGLLLGALLMYVWRRPRQAAALVAGMLLCHPALQEASRAGDGHDHDHSPQPKSNANRGTLEFEIRKETQFLFGIRTQIAQTSDFQPAKVLFGNVVPMPNGRAEVQAPQYGRITSVAVRVGQSVQAGQTVATAEQTISTSENVAISAQTGGFQVELEKAEQRLARAEKEWTRLQPIADLVGQKTLQQAQGERQQAQAEVTRLRQLVGAELPEAKNKNLSIKAPISGVVTQIAIAQGAYINQGQVLLVIENADKIYIEVQIPSSEYEQVRHSAQFRVAPLQQTDRQTEARLLYSIPSLNTYNQTHKLILEIDNSGNLFKIGEFVSVYAAEKQTNAALSLPVSAIALLEGLSAVFVKMGPEQFALRYVRAPESNGRLVTVERGLKASERVVVAGTYQAKMIFMNR